MSEAFVYFYIRYLDRGRGDCTCILEHGNPAEAVSCVFCDVVMRKDLDPLVLDFGSRSRRDEVYPKVIVQTMAVLLSSSL